MLWPPNYYRLSKCHNRSLMKSSYKAMLHQIYRSVNSCLMWQRYSIAIFIKKTKIRNQENFLPCGLTVKCMRNLLFCMLSSEWNFINIWSPDKRMFCPALMRQYLPTILPSLIISRQSELCIRNGNNWPLLLGLSYFGVIN